MKRLSSPAVEIVRGKKYSKARLHSAAVSTEQQTQRKSDGPLPQLSENTQRTKLSPFFSFPSTSSPYFFFAAAPLRPRPPSVTAVSTGTSDRSQFL